MQEMEVAAERRKSNAGARATYQLGESIEELNSQFGPDVVLSHARRSVILSLQSYIRTLVDAGKSESEIQTLVTAWKPTVKKAQKSAIDRVREELARMSPADRAILQKELRKQQTQAAA